MEGQPSLEAAAKFLLDSCCIDEPRVDPCHIAREWGYEVVDGDRSSASGAVLALRPGGMRRWDAAHELGHIASMHAGMNPRCEATAEAVAARILMPRRAFSHDVTAFKWDLAPLVTRYDVPWLAAARRLTEVRSAVTSVWEGSRLLRRYWSPWLINDPIRERPPEWERLLAAECQRWRCHLREDGRQVAAYNVGAQAVVVSAVETWEARTQSGRGLSYHPH